MSVEKLAEISALFRSVNEIVARADRYVVVRTLSAVPSAEAGE
jgi:hypothetical protein